MTNIKNANSFTADMLGRDTVFPELRQHEVKEMNTIIARLAGLGIEIADGFSAPEDIKEKDTQYRNDQHIAKICIFEGKPVPKDVEQRLLDRLYSRVETKSSTVDITLSDEEIEAFINGTK